MTAPKPHVKPKPDPQRCRSEGPLSDPPSSPDHDVPVFSEHDPGVEQSPAPKSPGPGG